MKHNAVILLILFLLFGQFGGYAQDKVTYLDEPFETNLDNWLQTLNGGTLTIVDNIDGQGKILKLTSVDNQQTFMSRDVLPSTPADEEYFIEYDYRTESIETVFDNMQINQGAGRLQTSLRGNTGTYWLHDNDLKRSSSPANFIQPNTWYHIKVRVNPATKTGQLTIDDTDFGEFTSDVNLPGVSSFQIKVLQNNTFYVDNLEIYTFGAPLPEPVDLPEVPNMRPRVMANPEYVEVLRTRFNAPSMSAYKTLLLQEANAVNSGILDNGVVSRSRYKAIESSAFLYLINNDMDAGQKAKRMVLENLSTAEQLTTGNQDRPIHRAILSAAFAYDWCYDLFTPQERLDLIADVKRLVKTTEYGFPLSDVNYIINHFGEEKVPNLLAFGIACYNEDPSIYEDVAFHLYEGLVPSRNFFYPAGKHHQGSAYGAGRYESEMWSTAIMTRMGAPLPYIEEQSKVLYNYMYIRRPDGEVMTEGDDFSPDLPSPPHSGLPGAFFAAQQFQDPYVQGHAKRNENFFNNFSAIRDATLIMLMIDETLESKPVTDLPLTRYSGSPFGSMVARTGWDLDGGKDSNVAIATMNLKEYSFGNHAHQDAGAFSLYYKGDLALDSGALSNSVEGSKFGGRSSHWFYYYQQSIAHNTLAVTDPNEPPLTNGNFPGVEQNEGGQPWRPGPFDFKAILAQGKQAEILSHGFGPDIQTPDYSYLKGDIAPSYAYRGRTPKVSESKRSFVFLNLKNENTPAALLVFDKVTSADPAFKKRWILHTEGQPEVIGNFVTSENTRDGYGGRLVNHTLLPEIDNVEHTVIGGTDKEFFTASTNKNFALQSDSEIAVHRAGRWRVEISPKMESATDLFLNVMQVTDAGSGTTLPVTKIENENVAGALIADRVVLFAKSGSRESGQRHWNMEDSEETLKFLITDLEAGAYDLYGREELRNLNVTEDEGALYFEGRKGSYVLVKAGETPDLSTLSTRSVEMDSKTFLYPNPVRNELYFPNHITKAKLISPSGRVWEETIENQSMQVSRIPRGFYIVEMTSLSGEVSFTKILVE